MTPALDHDLAHLDAVLARTLTEALDVLGSLEARPAAVAPAPATVAGLADAGQGFAAALAQSWGSSSRRASR